MECLLLLLMMMVISEGFGNGVGGKERMVEYSWQMSREPEVIARGYGCYDIMELVRRSLHDPSVLFRLDNQTAAKSVCSRAVKCCDSFFLSRSS